MFSFSLRSAMQHVSLSHPCMISSSLSSRSFSCKISIEYPNSYGIVPVVPLPIGIHETWHQVGAIFLCCVSNSNIIRTKESIWPLAFDVINNTTQHNWNWSQLVIWVVKVEPVYSMIWISKYSCRVTCTGRNEVPKDYCSFHLWRALSDGR